MKESTIAKRYSRALVESIREVEEFRDIQGQLIGFIEVMQKDPLCKTGMETLLLSKKQKREILETFRKKLEFGKKTLNFLLALVDENRMGFLESMIQFLETFWLEKSGIEKIKVFSAIALSPGQKERLQLELKKSFQKDILIENICDPSLIAGIKIQRGLVFYDFSLAGNLEKLEETLTGIPIPESLIKIEVHDANKG